MERTAERTAAIEDYVRAIYDLQRTESPVPTTVLARQKGVAPASVTGMIKRLHELGLVDHERYGGVRLTRSGEKVALEVIRHHRLIETFLAEAMGLAWDEVHEEAHRLEHHISENLEDRMAEMLGNPVRDPHGAPIPPKDGPFTEPAYASLADVQAAQKVVIREVMDEDPARLRYLAELGLLPDVVVDVIAVGPFDGPITLRVGADGTEHAIGRELARTISVEMV